MNILVVTPHGMYGNYTGSFIHNQAKAYVELGHRVRVVIPLAIGKHSNEGQRFGWPVTMHMQDGVEICYVRHLSLGGLGAKIFNGKSAALAVRLMAGSILRDFRPDVIHAHTIHFGGTVARPFQKFCKVPMVITTHGGDTDLALEPDMQASARTICNYADAVVAVSSTCQKKVASLQITSPTTYILNGFATQNVQEANPLPFRVIQVGKLSWQKRISLTIQAVAKLRETYPQVTLTVVGDGELREELENLCKQLQIEDIVQFLGYLTNMESLAEMAKSQIFIMPSVKEGFGIVYLEAMASGCITIGTRGEGIADVITHGENGFLVEPDSVESIAETIAYCFEHPNESTQIAARGRQEALQLTWEKNAGTYIELFQKMKEETEQ